MISKKHVKINPKPEIIMESPDESEHLQAMRISDFYQRKADKARIEKLLAPIFAPEFRDKIFKKYQNF